MPSALRLLVSRAKTAVYRRPMDELKRMQRWGPRAYFRCPAWAAEMEAAAYKLPPPGIASPLAPVELWFLTGARFWYQTAFCAWSFSRTSGREVVLNLVDDGSLSHSHEDALRRLFPKGATLRKENVRERIETHLPAGRFPILRQRWEDYVNIRKLTDIHLDSTGWKLVLDSDMLFFREPQALLAWWDGVSGAGPAPAGDGPCLMTDCMESYGYSRPLMESLCGAPIPAKLNVGICGLKSEELDWAELEHWCRTLREREGTSYYLEQALVAMLAARRAPVVMPPADYITFPTRPQTETGAGVLQHYVADSKPWYFGTAWKLTR